MLQRIRLTGHDDKRIEANSIQPSSQSSSGHIDAYNQCIDATLVYRSNWAWNSKEDRPGAPSICNGSKGAADELPHVK